MEFYTYLLGGDLNTNLLNGFAELIRLHSAVIVEIEILECLHQDGLLALAAACLLGQLVFELSLKAISTEYAGG